MISVFWEDNCVNPGWSPTGWISVDGWGAAPRQIVLLGIMIGHGGGDLQIRGGLRIGCAS